jgi:hypothetical protein
MWSLHLRESKARQWVNVQERGVPDPYRGVETREVCFVERIGPHGGSYAAVFSPEKSVADQLLTWIDGGVRADNRCWYRWILIKEDDHKSKLKR